MYIGLGGAITFKNARKPVDVAEMLPLDRLLLETDCPYMAPVPMRGKRNYSAYIEYVAEKIGEIKGIDPQTVTNQATENTKVLFGIE
jgi:TatD DNase family protein